MKKGDAFLDTVVAFALGSKHLSYQDNGKHDIGVHIIQFALIDGLVLFA